MKDETRLWLSYAEENFEMARLALERGYLNACLQNAQQVVETALKAALVEVRGEFPKTHSIRELVRAATAEKAPAWITTEECDLLDSIYIPSKYPVYGVLPEQFADWRVCIQCVRIAERVLAGIRGKF
ncbi:MAG TPA: HEPN domain-containing protein [Desulfuromonadales bacterium]